MNPLTSFGETIARSINQTVADYGVNPLIFIAIYVVSYLPYLWGVYWLGKGIRHRNNTHIIQGAAVNRLGWAAPYAYVIIYGHSLPIWFFVSLVAWTIVGIVLIFSEKQRKKLYRSADWVMDVAKSFKSFRNYSRLLKDKASSLSVHVVTDANSIAQAQQLHAEVYLSLGYIDDGMLGSDKRMTLKHDSYQAHATYFVLRDNAKPESPIVATARQIVAKPKLAHTSFPTYNQFELSQTVKDEIDSVNAHECVEISGLAKVQGQYPGAGLLLYRAMWQHSIQNNHKLWLMACGEEVYPQLKFMFGDTIRQISAKQHYMGGYVVPAIVEIPKALEYLEAKPRSFNPFQRVLRRRVNAFFLKDLTGVING